MDQWYSSHITPPPGLCGFPTWFANSRKRLVLSSGSLKTSLTSCSMGVMPVPPAIIPTFRAVTVSGGDFLSGRTLNTPVDDFNKWLFNNLILSESFDTLDWSFNDKIFQNGYSIKIHKLKIFCKLNKEIRWILWVYRKEFIMAVPFPS